MLIKEELLSYLTKGHIHIGKKDYLFFYNLQKFIENGKSITSKQNDLFNKLITKYQRQLKKEKFDITELLRLNWKTKLVPTDPELLIPKITLLENKLIIKTPYNKKFASALSSRTVLGQTFSWDKVNKTHVAEFNTINFKQVFGKIQDCFTEYKLCDKLRELVDSLEAYSGKIWEPTLIESNGYLYIIAVNENLYLQLKDVEIKHSLKTFYNLIKLGIKIDKSLLNDNVLDKFLNNHEVDVSYKETEIILKNLNDLGIDKVYIHSNSNNFLRNSTHVVLEQLKKYDIDFELLKVNFEPKVLVPNSISIKFSKSILTRTNISSDKVLVVANDTPIDIK